MNDPRQAPSRPGWFADLALGMKFAVSGGRSGWIRAALTALGVGIAVAMLLAAASVPTIVSSMDHRHSAKTPAETKKAGDDTLLIADAWDQYRDYDITGKDVRPEGSHPPVPVGIPRVPKAGEMYVSPALKAILSSKGGKLLAERFDAKVVGTIGDEGLDGPADLYYIRGSDTLTMDSSDDYSGMPIVRADGFGVPPSDRTFDPVLVLLIVVAVVVLLLPVVMFVSIAARFGGERRDRRLAALRLLGGDGTTLRRVAAGESMLGAIGGIALGIVFLLIGREFSRGLEVQGLSAFPSDIVPNPVLGVLVVVSVPLVAIMATLMAMRRVVVEPLGVVRQARGTKRRVWWRILVLLAGVGLIALSLTQDFEGGPGAVLTVGVAILLCLLGGAVMLPWVMDTVVKRMRGGAPGWQLATRRLQISGSTAARVVNGVSVAAAGGIALQMMFTGAQAQFTEAQKDPANGMAQWADVVVTAPPGDDGTATLTDMKHDLSGIDGATRVASYGSLAANAGGDNYQEIMVAPCADLRKLTTVRDCVDGDVFASNSTEGKPLRPGEVVKLTSDYDDPPQGLAGWKVPTPRATVSPTKKFVNMTDPVLLVTPKAMDARHRALAEPAIGFTISDGHPDAIEHMRNAAAKAQPHWAVSDDVLGNRTEEDKMFSIVRKALLAGVIATMVLIGLGFLISTLEQLQERRRLLSALSAFGTRKRTMTASVMWQTAIPVAIGLALSTTIGIGLGAALMKMTDLKVSMDWANIGTILGLGAAMVLGVTILSMPLLWRLMRPDGIRTE